MHNNVDTFVPSNLDHLTRSSRTFPALINFDGSMYHADFIDLKEISGTGKTIQEACFIAQRKMIAYLKEHSDIPEPNLDFSHTHLSHRQMIVLISSDTNVFRDTLAVKKTLTIPSWLNDLAMENNINFSQLLQKALKKELGIID